MPLCGMCAPPTLRLYTAPPPVTTAKFLSRLGPEHSYSAVGKPFVNRVSGEALPPQDERRNDGPDERHGFKGP
jgi:hypothetical protein